MTIRFLLVFVAIQPIILWGMQPGNPQTRQFSATINYLEAPTDEDMQFLLQSPEGDLEAQYFLPRKKEMPKVSHCTNDYLCVGCSALCTLGTVAVLLGLGLNHVIP